MADYININGNNIPIRASDPSNPIAGEIWYNLTTNALKGQIFQSAAWATATAFPYLQRDAGGFGNQTAAAIFGGTIPGGISNATTTYDGTNWTTQPNFPSQIQGLQGEGTLTAGIQAGGSPPSYYTSSHDYNGTTWTANPSMGTGRANAGTVGGPAAQSAMICVSGEGVPTSQTTTDEWNGSTWTAGAAIPGWSQGTSGGGDTSSGWVQAHTTSETGFKQYNGTSWSDGTATPNQHNYGGGGGPTNNLLAFGGGPTPLGKAKTDNFNGTSWTTLSDMNEGRGNAHGAGTQNGEADNVVGGGNPAGGPGFTTSTEEWNGAGLATVTFSNS
jgi:hypothetical protein